jgi:hypothetical protein
MEGLESIRNEMGVLPSQRGQPCDVDQGQNFPVEAFSLSKTRVDQAVCDECLCSLHFPKSWLLRLWTTRPTL